MIYKLTLGELKEYCYIITEDNKTCVIIDAGEDFDVIDNFLKQKNLEAKAILLTHGHFDHSASCKKFQQKGVRVYVHKLDADKLYTGNNLANMFGKKFDYFFADELIEQGQLVVNNISFNVLHTPGHSKGSVVYIYGKNIFCGDLIFEHGYGRYDFYDGDFDELKNSIKKMMPYLKNKDYVFLYGH